MKTVRVLIVDDQVPFRRAAQAVVESTDSFVVIGAVATAEDALASVAELEPDLVLMDVNLPGIDGMEASRRLRGIPSAGRRSSCCRPTTRPSSPT